MQDENHLFDEERDNKLQDEFVKEESDAKYYWDAKHNLI